MIFQTKIGFSDLVNCAVVLSNLAGLPLGVGQQGAQHASTGSHST